jgi:hypothetical protein
MCLLALATCVFGLGDGRLEPNVAAAVPPAHCNVAQKTPLYVGFAEGMTLDSFEPAAEASRAIWYGFKAWLCEASADPKDRAPRPHALHAALAAQHAVRVEQVQFDDPAMFRAHVVLLDLAADPAVPSGWHVHLERSDDGWHVTTVADAADHPSAP